MSWNESISASLESLTKTTDRTAQEVQQILTEVQHLAAQVVQVAAIVRCPTSVIMADHRQSSVEVSLAGAQNAARCPAVHAHRPALSARYGHRRALRQAAGMPTPQAPRPPGPPHRPRPT